MESHALKTALDSRGIDVRLHRDRFAPNAPDDEWLPVVGQLGWVILTRDAKMRHVPVEFAALESVGARQFVIRGGNLRTEQIIALLDTHWSKIERLARRPGGGFVAHVTRSAVEVKLEFAAPRRLSANE